MEAHIKKKSWFEMWEDEEEKERLSKFNNERNKIKTDESGISITEEIISDKNARKSVTIESEVVRIPKSKALLNFSVSHLKASSANEMTKTNGVQKADSKRVNTHEDLSISSHLNLFKIDNQFNDDLESPKKFFTSYYLKRNIRKEQKSRNGRIQQSGGFATNAEDNILKLRNRSIIRPSAEKEIFNSRERIDKEENSLISSIIKPIRRKKNKSPPESIPKTSEKDLNNRTHRDRETDPIILRRRMKQIEYGKNTIGYGRYTQLVPRESREKRHPKTPPMHVKFSRRAWDGLVKVWRVRLHYWDPPSMGGRNHRSLELGNDFSDLSGTEGSVAGTPGSCRKQQRQNHSKLTKEEEDQDLGCVVLPPE